MEKYILEKQESFNLKHIFECGQCFRWNKLEDNSYIGVIKDAVINVKEENGKFIFTGSTINGNLKEIIRYYFDLDTNYTEYKKILSNIDNYLKESIKFGSGIRILRQDLWECIISFIISANNNIPRIKKIIEKLSKEYGKKIKKGVLCSIFASLNTIMYVKFCLFGIRLFFVIGKNRIE